MSEIHRVTFEERLDRVQTNLHMVVSELLSITSMCEAHAPLNRITTRLESAVILFLGEARTTRDLLYQPRLMVEEGVMAAILATLASAMNVLAELLEQMPSEFSRSQPLTITLSRLTGLAQEICGECVPHTYTPASSSGWTESNPPPSESSKTFLCAIVPLPSREGVRRLGSFTAEPPDTSHESPTHCAHLYN